jgi:hypothetical protein
MGRWLITMSLLVAVVLMGCGGGGKQLPTGALSIRIVFPPQRIIPPETQRVRVKVSGEGLTEPVEKIAERPSTEGGEVTVVFTDLPVGSKTVTANAEDRYGTRRAIGSAEATVVAGQTATVDVELNLTNFASVIGRLVNARTGGPAVGVTVQVGERQATSGNDGFFAVTDVPEGQGQLQFSSSDYRGYTKTITVTVPETDLGEILLLPQQLMEPPDQPF